ncbi:cytosolic carboxypeptidase Nna1 isoform X2 [Glossina fuscipes]|uniref:Cytosolic carboxypeptidase Nna1 isoform X2 n=1 Tax=Glossina fuscipes TaxID=7396 RepID=A0A8U0WCX0_9MUSC|nr:cytosolic carboxypeptidase Nna1 isoform X2 [Glossina fuscipes]
MDLNAGGGRVQFLQAQLFPVCSLTPAAIQERGYLGNFLTKGLRTNQLEVNTDERTLRPIARLKEPRELFALPKDKEHGCSQQAPRWPIECQVLEERIIHIPNVPDIPEFYYRPSGNELKPRPVGEENGIVVFNYNPISAVNYGKKSKKKYSNDDDSSDSDNSSCESRCSSPDLREKEIIKTQSLSKLITTLEQRSSSNSNDDDDDDDDDSEDNDDIELNGRKLKCNGKKYPESKIESTDIDKEIEDIWANKSPGYNTPPTPSFFKRKFDKNLQDHLKANGLQESKIPTTISPVRLNNELSSKFEIDMSKSSSSSISSNSDNPTEDGEVDGDEDYVYQQESQTPAPSRPLIEPARQITVNSAIEVLSAAAQSPPCPNTLELKNSAPVPTLLMQQSDLNNADSNWPNKSSNNAPNNINNTNQFQDNQNIARQNTKPKKPPQFSRSAVNGAKIVTNCHPYNPEEYDGLEFESRFESGNLARAVRITPTYYELYLRPDLYTSRSKQWFYFRVRRTRKNVIYRFSIVNLVKSNSLYNDGMRPLLYSTINAKTRNEGWRRCGDNICYYCNEDENQPCSDDEVECSYTLTFNIEFSHDNDTVYFAHSYPYTYSDLQDYLMNIQNDPVKSKFCKLRLLCRTLAGNNVYYLTVTAPTTSDEIMKRKKSIVVSARVHPSETPSSWMMKGLMDFITADTAVAKRLRHKFIFKLIPMLNPDGVIVGNTRNSLTGKDLNRQYRTVIRETYPSIWYTKALIKRLIDECGVSMYCDMHAHSRTHNIFVYGCENKRNAEKKLSEQVFPLMMHKNVADKFSFENCKFKVQRSKEGTGRIVVWMLGITNSYTLEASFGGSTLGSRKGTHFSTMDYEHMGRVFCETLLDYSDENPNKYTLYIIRLHIN